MTKRTKKFVIVSSIITIAAALALLGVTIFVESMKTPLPMQLGLGAVVLGQLIIQLAVRRVRTKA